MIDYRIIHHLPTDGNPVYIKQMHLKKGYCVDTHKHKFDHFGILGKGRAIVEVDGVSNTYDAPFVIEIKAEKVHKITALESITWFCVHGAETFDVHTGDQVLIKEN